MSETMSSPSDWAQFYQQNLSAAGQDLSARAFGDQPSDAATVVTSSTITSTGPTTSTGTGHLSPEGRVGKPVRRRSRASRRTPTTLLNTDTTNFRAMVQQFTGGPSAPFAAAGSPHPGGPSFGFSFGGGRHHQLPSHVNPAGSLAVPPAGFHLQYQPQQQSQSQGYMFPLNSGHNNNTGGGGGGGGELLFERVGGNAAAGFTVEGVSSQLPGHGASTVSASRSTPPGSSNENRSNATTFMF